MCFLRLPVLAFCTAGILWAVSDEPLPAGEKDKKADEPKKVSLTGTVKTGIVAAGGETLRRFACFQAIVEGRGCEDWRQWPTELRDGAPAALRVITPIAPKGSP